MVNDWKNCSISSGKYICYVVLEVSPFLTLPWDSIRLHLLVRIANFVWLFLDAVLSASKNSWNCFLLLVLLSFFSSFVSLGAVHFFTPSYCKARVCLRAAQCKTLFLFLFILPSFWTGSLKEKILVVFLESYFLFVGPNSVVILGLHHEFWACKRVTVEILAVENHRSRIVKTRTNVCSQSPSMITSSPTSNDSFCCLSCTPFERSLGSCYTIPLV